MPKGDREKGKADPEDGTTPVANLLLEGLAIANLTSRERAAMLFLIRRTYGWSNNGTRLKEDIIPLATWVKILQVKDTSRASKILTDLANKRLIHRKLLGAGKSYIYSINTTLADWNNCLDMQLLSEMTTLALSQMTRVLLSQKTTPPNTNLATLKEKERNIKESNIYRDRNKEKRTIPRNTDPDRFIKGRYGHMVRR